MTLKFHFLSLLVLLHFVKELILVAHENFDESCKFGNLKATGDFFGVLNTV